MVSNNLRSLVDAQVPNCTQVLVGNSFGDLVACSLPSHAPGTDHVCVGDDGGVLATWPNRVPESRPASMPARLRAS